LRIISFADNGFSNSATVASVTYPWPVNNVVNSLRLARYLTHVRRIRETKVEFLQFFQPGKCDRIEGDLQKYIARRRLALRTPGHWPGRGEPDTSQWPSLGRPALPWFSKYRLVDCRRDE
jgi:hypothetical protein